MEESKTDKIKDDAMIFGLLLIISNKMSTLLERELKEFDVTTMQWFLIETIHSIFDNPPTMKNVAVMMGSSHQNIKQVALKLQQKGLIILEKDSKDARVTRLRVTQKSKDLWSKINLKGDLFRINMFKAMNSNEITVTRQVLEELLNNLNVIGNDED
ncbi:MAG TPA: MarR family transcriptional regulator [Clostridia bacterium]|jgi:DNA-binding MarR family transcriptional regulator|nr:MarR family transcriptional regulator [Clostridia bacterium]